MTTSTKSKPRPIGSILFYLGYLVLMFGLGLPLIILAIPFPLRQRFALLNLYNRSLLKWLQITCGIKYKFEGLENLPQEKFVMVANHQSEWETIILHLFKTPMCTVLKQELLRIPIFGWGLKLIKPIPLDRSQPTKMLRKVITLGGERLAEGISILIFPEGTRIAPGKYKPFSKSAALVACNAQVPVIAAAHNAGEHWNPKSWIKRSGTITLRFSPPFSSAAISPEELTKQTQHWIETQLQEISAVPRPALPKSNNA